ncbi:MAG TPA: thioesterase II family protein [Pyrinomonadaceae bacterium]|nr:thioesterase II family protein [Pyrinomonadaceae bacterium]
MATSERMAAGTSQWVVRQRPAAQAALRLFCLPYAGGGAYIYRDWAEHLPAKVEVCPIQLPGRGNRLREAPATRMAPLVEAIAGAITPLLDKPFAIFGHSMGALIGFELARFLGREHGKVPSHLFVSGRSAPQVPDADKRTYDLPEPEFIEELRRLNGTPQEVLDHPELMQMMIPILRADFETIQTYEYQAGRPLDCPISAMGGIQDPDVTRQDLEAWREETSGPFTLRMFPGGHFLINTARPMLLQAITKELHQSGVLS